jgi:hypothetical protein
MKDNYEKLVRNNLDQLYKMPVDDLAINLQATRDGNSFIFNAFGEQCILSPGGITLGKKEHSSIFGILISLYGLHNSPEACIPQPFKSFKELPNSMPYVGAFTTYTEQALIPHVPTIKGSIETITETLHGSPAPPDTSGDFAFVLYPLPKIALLYIFYEADEDFPASATCLYSQNADHFMPIDGLADVGEYTSKRIIEIIS